MLTVIPMLISYQLGIVLVWNMNRRNLRRRYSTLFAKDQAIREDRLQRAQTAYVLPTEALRPAPVEPVRLVDIDSVIMPSRKSAIASAMTASTCAVITLARRQDMRLPLADACCRCSINKIPS